MPHLKPVLRWVLGIAFVLAGLNHFRRDEFYVRITPPYLPWHRELVYLSGVCEIALGVLLLVPRYSRLAAWGLIALLIAVFPANLHMALNPHLFPEIPPVLLWARLPFQAVFIAWALWSTGFRRPARRSDGAPGSTRNARGDAVRSTAVVDDAALLR